MTDFGFDNVANDSSDTEFNTYLNTGGTDCNDAMSGFSTGTVYPFSPVSFRLVKCYKEADKKFPTKTTAMTAWFTCMKTSLAAVDMDVASDFFFSEKLSLHHNFKVMDSWAESDWTYASLGGFSHCVARKCTSKFYDEDWGNGAAGIFTTAWGRAYHIDIGTKIDAECSKTKVGATPKAGDAIDLKGYNDCFKALLPHMVGQDRKRIMCFSMCANPPGLFKGPYGPSPVVNSAVDGEIYTSSSDGEFIREKAKILNDLVTCAGKVSTFDFVGPMEAKLED